MIKQMLASALFAGVAAGLIAAALHFAFVQKYILLGEEYETAATVHFAGVAPPTTDAPLTPYAHDHGDHDHDHGEASTFERNSWTAVFSGLVYIAYAMILVAGFGLARVFGHAITARDGLLWGIAGFAAFQLAPAMGLPPELPGTSAADLGARQVWWWGTVLATATALGLIGYGRGVLPLIAAAVLLAAPHLIGAPTLDGFSGLAPPEVSGAFSARVLGVGLAVWAVMGWAAGWVWAGKAEGSRL